MKTLLVGLAAASFTLAAAAVQAQSVVDFVKPDIAEVEQELALTGSVTTPYDSTLSTQIEGLVAEVRVDAGDRVEVGQVLLQIDSALAALALKREAAAVREAKTRLDEARRLRDEAKPLAQRGSLAQSEYATRQAEAELALAALARLEAQRDEQAERVARHVVKAPFAGVIRQRLTAPGEWVAPGQALFELVSTDELRVDVRVPQQSYAGLLEAQRANIFFDALPGQTFAGRIDARVAALDAQARTFLVRVALDGNHELVVPGMFARVRFALPGSKRAVAIPRDALVRFPDGSTVVWLVDEQGQAQRQPVVLGAQRGERVIVTEGLSPEDRVVVRGNESLRPGQAVEARSHVAP